MRRAVLVRAAAIACMAWLAAMLGTASAQEWRKLREEGANFYDVKRSFEKAEAQSLQKGTMKKERDEEAFEDEEEEGGYTQFKRWEYWMEPRAFPSGDLPAPDQNFKAMQQYFQQHGALMKGAGMPAFMPAAIPAANWTSLGPTSWVLTSNSVAPGLGRVSAITFDPTNPNTIWIGTPAGGLWKSTNGGASWSTNTANLPVLGVSSIMIDPTNTNIMYIATGDNDASDTQSVGVLKSTDGGATWNTTGLNWTVTQTRRIYKLIMHPTNSNILLAATTDGIYKTTDGGATWSRKLSSSWKDIEFKPGDPTVVYAAWTTLLYRSTNTGDNWTSVALPSSAMNRFAIAVTPANPSYVYILASKSVDNSFLGLYRSTDSGLTFTTQSTTPNIFGYETDGSDAGKGQGNYDIAFAVTPTNADELYIGGVNIWKSTNGGVNWTNKTHWKYSTNPAAYVHADVHLFEFNGSNVYTGTDGGFFKSTDGGTTWTDLSAGMNTTEYYRIASDPNSANLVYGGAQDNTITRYSGSNIWDSFLSGDGAECLVDRTNSNIVYSATQSGSIKRSSNAGVTWSSIKNNITETGAWVTPYVMDPVSNTTLYAGYVNVWKTTNSGTSWTKLSTFANTNTIVDLQVAPSNANYIYVTKTANVYRSSDGGANWTDITAGLPTAAYKQIAVASNDPQKIWITLSGYLSGQKVYASTDGGATWSNYSGTLPNLPFNTIVYHNNGGTDALYAGADVGVYYRDNTLSDWQLYQTDLPNVPISELEIHASSGKLRAGTFGRGLWQTDLVPAAAPAAALAFDGVDDYVTRTLPSMNSLTIETWVKFSGSTANSEVILFTAGDPNFSFSNRIHTDASGHFVAYVFDGSVIEVTGTTVAVANTWYHVALVADESTLFPQLRLYVNGILEGTPASYEGKEDTPTMVLGHAIAGATSYLNGALDEVRIWNVARSQTHIQNYRNCELSGAQAGLVAYYKCNQGLASANNTGIISLADASGNVNDGTFNNFALTGSTSNFVAPGGVTSGTICPPLVGAALAFDAANDYVSTSLLSTATSNVTLEGWVKYAGATGIDQVIFYNGNTSTSGYGIVIHNNRFHILLGGVNLSNSLVIPTLGVWTHLALVGSGTSWNLYRNGTLIHSFSGAAFTPTDGFAIGAAPQTGTSNFNGAIDEVRFWSVVRSQADIQATRNCELTGTEADLVAYYKFNQGFAEANNAGVTTLTDAAGGDNNGTLNNFALTGTTSNWVTPGGVTSGTTCSAAAMLIANAGNDNPHSGGATKLTAFASGGAGDYKYEWAVASGPNASNAQFSNAAATKTVFTPTATGNYVLRFTAKDAMNAIAVDNVAVQVNALNSASISGPDPVAPSSLNSYTVTTDASNPTFFWVVTNGTITEAPSDNPPPGDANTRNPVLIEAGNPNFPMLVEVYVTDGNTNDVTYALKSVTINNPNALSANAGPDRTIIVGGSATIGGSPSAIGGVPPLTYQWSPTTGLNNPNAANPIASPITSTTYTLTVSDGFGLVATDQVDVNVVIVQVKPFVLVGNTVTLKRTALAPAGNVHSNGVLTVEAGRPSTYKSNLTAIGKITIEKDNTINGNVRSKTSISNAGTITGTKTIGPVSTELLPSLSYTAGGSSKTVPKDGALTLTPGSYNVITINTGSTLRLQSGEYFINELRYSSSEAVIQVDLASRNPVKINVVKTLQLGAKAVMQLLPNGESDSKLVTVNTRQTSSITFGHAAYLLGSFNVPNAKVTLGNESQLRGSLYAKEVVIEKDCMFLHHDSPGTLPGPGNLPRTFAEDDASSEPAPVTNYELAQNYPNPFNPSTEITFALPEAGSVTVVLYSLTGQIVKELANGDFASGRHQLLWDGRDESGAVVAGGVYFYRLTVQGESGEAKFTQTRKMMFVK